MALNIGILNEQLANRVCIVPKVATKIMDLGANILLESDAGAAAMFANSDYKDVQVCSREEVFAQADVLLCIQAPEEELTKAKPNCLVIAEFKPFFDKEVGARLDALGLRAMSMDMIPRTTLAQSMDVLSSMASIAGYKAVLEAANLIPRYFPMMITAAGSIKPSKVLILGAGVAGLQAIATARRLGAQVEAFDTRSAAKQEVESLGARFIEVEGAKEDTGAGGYAVEQDEDFIRRQREEVKKRSMDADVIITTAQVRGRKAPILVTEDTVAGMRPGSVIVDLAASTGGNCALTQEGLTQTENGINILGDSNLADRMPQDASVLYANNLFNLLKLLVRDGKLTLDFENEIISSAFITSKEKI